MQELIVEADRMNLPLVQSFIDEQLEAVDLCPPRKNRQKTYAKNRMKRMTNMI